MLSTNEKVIEVLKDCIENNLTALEASRKHNVEQNVLYNWARKAGVKLKSAKNPSYDWDFIKKELKK